MKSEKNIRFLMLLGSPGGHARGWAMRANGREGRGLPLGVRASRESPGKVAHRGVHRRWSWALSRRGLAVWLFGRPVRRRRVSVRVVTTNINTPPLSELRMLRLRQTESLKL